MSVENAVHQSAASPPPDVVRFLHAAAGNHGIPCTLWLPAACSTADAVFTIARDCLEVQPMDGVTKPFAVPLGFLRTAVVASENVESLPAGLSEAWAECAVLLEFFDVGGSELRAECLLLANDVDAALLCRSLSHLQRFGIVPPSFELDHVTSRARSVFAAALASPDIEQAVRQWRAGKAWRQSGKLAIPEGASRPEEPQPGRPVVLKRTTALWSEAAQGMWEMLSSPSSHPWGFSKRDPSLVCGWDVPQPHQKGGSGNVLEAEGELSERWRQLLGTRRPSELSRGELRAAFALGDRIPWQYRFALWPAWMGVDKAASEGLTDSDCAVDEVCRRQIEKDMSRTRPNEMNKSQVEALGRVLRAYAVRTPTIGYCQGMNFVVAVVLLAGFTEEQALGGLAHLVDKFCEGYYEHSMRGVLRDVAVLDALLSLMLPGIHARLIEINLPLIWIAAEPFLTLFSRGAPLESVCRLWDFFLIEGSCATFAVFLAYAELAHERNLLEGAEAEDALGAFTLLLGDAGAIAGSLLRRAAHFLAPRPFGGGLNVALLEGLRNDLAAAAPEGCS